MRQGCEGRRGEVGWVGGGGTEGVALVMVAVDRNNAALQGAPRGQVASLSPSTMTGDTDGNSN